MATLRFLVERAGHSVLLLFAVLILNFFLLHIMPGNVAQTIASQMGGATPEILAQIRETYGLDRPLWMQLLTYITNVATGDFGTSFFYQQPVLSLILERLPATLLLVLSAQIVSVLTGILLGVFAAQKPNSLRSYVVTVLAVVGYATPVFWLGLMLLIVFAYYIPLFPTSGMQSIGVLGGPFSQVVDVLHHLVLPAFTLAVIYLAQYTRIARSSMINTLGADYVRTARAKGMPEWVITYKHALKNALIPVVTLAGLQFSRVFAGAVVVEVVFNWPGMGVLAYDAMLRRDFPLLLGILFFSAIVVVVVNLLTDVIYQFLDPRIRSVEG